MYRTVAHVAEQFDICPDEVRRKINRMKRSGVYPQTTFLTNPIRVNLDTFIHYNTYQYFITNGKQFPEWRGE